MAKAYSGNGSPFSRARDYALLLASLTLGANKMSLIDAIASVGNYESRGHGKSKTKTSGVRAKAYAKMSRQRSTYAFGQVTNGGGKQEIACRLRTAPEPIARRMWTVALGTPWGDSVIVASSSRSGVARTANKMLATGNYHREQTTPVLGVLHG